MCVCLCYACVENSSRNHNSLKKYRKNFNFFYDYINICLFLSLSIDNDT